MKKSAKRVKLCTDRSSVTVGSHTGKLKQWTQKPFGLENQIRGETNDKHSFNLWNKRVQFLRIWRNVGTPGSTTKEN